MTSTKVTITVEFDHDDLESRFGVPSHEAAQYVRDFIEDGPVAEIRDGGPDPVITYQENR